MEKKPTYEELEKRISELEYELKINKKYGLVWDKEDTKEDVVLHCEKDIPIFIQEKSRRIITNAGENNVLIEGDNYHVLTALNFVLKETIDIIYIDPPYNTGENDFTYNDNYVDSDDGYRHSKWLSFMEKRLKLARELMKKDAVLFLSIGDDEVNNIGLLLNNIFGENNFIGLLPRIGKKSGKTTSTIAKNHDFLFIYAKDKSCITFARQSIERDESKLEQDEFFEERGPYRLNQCLDYDSLTYSTSMDYPLEIDGQIFYAGGSKDAWEKRQNGQHSKFDWTWRWSPSLVKFGLSNGFIVIKKGKRTRLYTKTYTKVSIQVINGEYSIVKTDDSKSYQSIVFLDNIYSNDNAKKELASLGLKDKFDFPKPTSLIKTCIKMAGKKDPVVLDFFAGSGTTGQAVMELNSEDGGHRRFILCTNNENNICTDITYPRLKTVISGIRQDGTKYSEGLPNNLFYFKTDFFKDESNTEQARYSLVEKVDGLLCIAENIFEEVERNDYSSHYQSKNRHLFIFNDYYSKEKFDEFKNRILKADGSKIVYIYSSDNNVDPSLIIDKDVIIKAIPSKIYEIYKEIVEGIKRGE